MPAWRPGLTLSKTDQAVVDGIIDGSVPVTELGDTYGRQLITRLHEAFKEYEGAYLELVARLSGDRT